MSGEFEERCEVAARDLEAMSTVVRDGRDRGRLLAKAEGVRLALSYLRDYPTAEAAAAARLRSLAAIYEQPLNRDATFTFTGRELAAMLKEEG